MALTSYLQRTQLLLNDLSNQYYQSADLTTYVNEGRRQVAITSEVLIVRANKTVATSENGFLFSSVTSPSAALLSMVNMRSASVTVAGTPKMMEGRPIQWLRNYYETGPAASLTGAPTVWAQLNQGVGAQVYFRPTANQSYVLSLESVWTPIALVDDATAEALPYPWTDAVPFYAAYLALMQAQRAEEAQRMMGSYLRYVEAARLGVTPGTLPVNFPPGKGLPSTLDPSLSMQGQTKVPARLGEGTL